MRAGGEQGVALTLVIFAIAITGLLVTGVFAGAYFEQRIGADVLFARQAFEAAEGQLAGVVSGWDPAANGVLAPGQGRALPVTEAGHLRSRATITRLNAQLYLIAGLGERVDGAGTVLARRRLGVIVRLAPDSATVRPITERSWAQLYE